MHCKLAISFIFIVAVSAVEPALKRYDGDQVLRLEPSNRDHILLLNGLLHNEPAELYDFWTYPPSSVSSRPVDIRIASSVLADFKAKLDAVELKHSVLIDNVQFLVDRANAENRRVESKSRKFKFLRSDVATDMPDDIVGQFASYEKISEWLNWKCQQYSRVASCLEIGKSFENRQISVVRISLPVGQSTETTKKAVFIEAGMHAREWLSSATAIYLIDRLIKAANASSSSNVPLRRLLERTDWYIVPLANPDGYQHTRTSDRMWRKTRSKGGDVYGCVGVDPNRNFDFHWSEYGSSFTRCSEEYHGTAPFSEPETLSISQFILSSKQQFLAYFSLHAFSQLWLVPFSHRLDEKPADIEELLRVAAIGTAAVEKAAASFHKNTTDAEWRYGNALELLEYPASGTSGDWAKGVANISYAYALELRPKDVYSYSDYFDGFLAMPSDIDKSGVEVLAGLTEAVTAMLEQPLNKQLETPHQVGKRNKPTTTLSGFIDWLVSVFDNTYYLY